MKPLKQLIRSPFQSFLAVLLLSAACSFLCISTSAFLSVKKTAGTIEDEYITLAVPNMEAFGAANGISMQAVDGWNDTLAAIDSNTSVKGIYQHGFTSAMSPDLMPLLSAQEAMHYDPTLDKPSNIAAFVVQVTELKKTSNGGWDASAEIEQTVLLHPEYTIRSHLQFNIWNPGQNSEMEPPEIGQTYLVYGSFADDDLILRQRLAERVRCPIEEIDLSNISSKNISALKKDLMSHGFTEGLDDMAAEYYHEKTGRSTTITQDELDMIDSTRIFPQVLISSETDKPFITVVSIEEPIESFLDREENDIWVDLLNDASSSQHCFPVIGTDRADTLFSFCCKTMYLAQGRMFYLDEYNKGDKVCIISESLALQNGLRLGDKISMQFYGNGDPFEREFNRQSNPFAQMYCAEMVLDDSSEEYEIIGLYRQTNTWEYGLGQWTPNTIFVPKKACPETIVSPHNALFLSVVLKNGSVQRFLADLEKKGFAENSIQIIDSGYEAIADPLETSIKSASRYFVIAIFFWSVTFSVYLLFFVSRQKKNAVLMRSLGASSKDVFRYLFLFASSPAMIATVIGVIMSLLGMDTVMHYFNLPSGISAGMVVGELQHMGSHNAEFEVSVRPNIVFLVAAIQGVTQIGMIFLQALFAAVRPIDQ